MVWYGTHKAPVLGGGLAAWWDVTTYTPQRGRVYTSPASRGRIARGGAPVTRCQLEMGLGDSHAETETMVDVTLPNEPPGTLTPGANLTLGETSEVSCPEPIEATVLRRQITFESGGKPNQPAAYYTPITTTATSQLPVLLTVYPGPVAYWECASLPLAAARFTLGRRRPGLRLELESILTNWNGSSFIRAGSFRAVISLNCDSWRQLQRLARAGILQRTPTLEAVVLLGPPTDLFDMRRRLEDRTSFPPFGLDQAMIALGCPTAPRCVTRYSGAYHIDPNLRHWWSMHSSHRRSIAFCRANCCRQLAKVGVAHNNLFF